MSTSVSRECVIGGRTLLNRCYVSAESTSSLTAPCQRRSPSFGNYSSADSPGDASLFTNSRRSDPVDNSNVCWTPLPDAAGEIMSILMQKNIDEREYLDCSPPTRACNPLVRDSRFFSLEIPAQAFPPMYSVDFSCARSSDTSFSTNPLEIITGFATKSS